MSATLRRPDRKRSSPACARSGVIGPAQEPHFPSLSRHTTVSEIRMTRGKANDHSLRGNNPTGEYVAKHSHFGSFLARRHRTTLLPGRDARYAGTKLTMRPPATPYSRGRTGEALCIRDRYSDQRRPLCHAPSRHTSSAKDFGNMSVLLVRSFTARGQPGPWNLALLTYQGRGFLSECCVI